MAKKIKAEQRKASLADAASEAYSILQELGEEMREAFDNTPESLQQGGAGAARGDAADALEALNEVEVDDLFGVLPVEYMQSTTRRPSRSFRRDNAVEILTACVEVLGDLVDDEEKIKVIAAENTDKSIDDIRDAAESLKDELESLKDEAEAVDFPGMYG